MEWKDIPFRKIFLYHDSGVFYIKESSSKWTKTKALRYTQLIPAAGQVSNGMTLISYYDTIRIDEKADLVIRLVKNLNVQYGFERSFKFLKKNLLWKRFLMGFKTDTVKQKSYQRILDICQRIDMPENYLETFKENISKTNIILFGFEENESTCLYKAYLEFGSRFKEVFKDNPNKPDPFIIHLGFKWDASDNTRCTIARYTCFPSFSIENMLERLSNIFYSRKSLKTFEIVKDIVNLASNKIGQNKFLYFEVNEENNPRISFDFNMYRANLRLKELYPFLLKMCRYYSIPSGEFNILYEPVKNQIFGHLTGGTDKKGRDFLTIYFGEKGSSR